MTSHNKLTRKTLKFPPYWYRPPQMLQTGVGMQRFVWDLKYAPPPAFSHGFPISAIYKDTPLYPLGPEVLPGTYTVRLIANGKTQTQTITVKMDPRVKTASIALSKQFNLSFDAYNGMDQSYKTVIQMRTLRDQIKASIGKVGPGPLADALNALEKKAAGIAGEGRADASSPGLPGGGVDVPNPNLTSLNNGFSSLLENLQSADLQPTEPTVAAAAELQRILAKLLADWNELKSKDLAAVNEQLKAANQTVLVP